MPTPQPKWFVFNPSGYTPRFVHATELDARIEAERLAEQNPGQEFLVLKTVASCKKRSPVEWTEIAVHSTVDTCRR